ncbi:MAG: STAS domain-containing protein [Armatimonadota bacterium]
MQQCDPNESGRVEIALVDGSPRIRMTGDCDISMAHSLAEHLEVLLETRPSNLVLDLEMVTFLDSSILRLFLAARRELEPSSVPVVLLCRPGFVRRLLSLLELDQLLHVCTPEEWRQKVASVH